MSPPACQDSGLDPESVTSGLGGGAHALWFAWMAGALVLIPTTCVYAIICACMTLGVGFIHVKRLQQALKKGASRPGHLGEASRRRDHVMQLEEWEERLPGEAGCGKSDGGRGRAWAKARRDDLESVRKTEDSVQHGYTDCGRGPQSPEAFPPPRGVRVGSKFINIGRPTWPCAQTQDVSELWLA